MLQRRIIHGGVMMEEKKHTQKEEDFIREMMQTAKTKAPEKLKYRIMQQIETEKALTPSKENSRKESGNILKEFGSIFGTMYAVLAVMIAATYFLFGREYLLSPQFLGTVLLVASVFSLLWLIARLDSHLRKKKNMEKG